MSPSHDRGKAAYEAYRASLERTTGQHNTCSWEALSGSQRVAWNDAVRAIEGSVLTASDGAPAVEVAPVGRTYRSDIGQPGVGHVWPAGG